MMIEIPVSGPLDVPLTLERYRLWGEDPANVLVDGALLRAIKVDGRWRGYELRWRGHADTARLVVMTPGVRSTRVLEAAALEAVRICGLGFDLDGFYRAAKTDPALA